MKKSLMVFVVCLLAAGMLFAAGAREKEDVYHLRASTNLADTGTVGKALQYFVDEINEVSDGRILATANFGSELGGQREQVEMMRTGSLEMVAASPPSVLSAFVPQLLALNIPYLFEDEAQFAEVLEAMEDEISQLLEPFNIVTIGGQNMGFRHVLIAPRPVYSPDDFRGLNMRGPNPVYVEMFERLGASGVTTDWTDVYTSLQTGVIDGMEASPDMIYSMRFHEQAQYLSKTFHIAAAVYYSFNKEWLESLPADLYEIVVDTARKAAAYQNEIDLQAQQDSLQKMMDEGVKVNEVDDLSEFADLTAPMVESFRERGPEWADFIDKILAAR